MMRDYDRVASLFTPNGALRIPHISAEAASREEIRAWGERVQALWDYFVQTTHPGTIQLDGDTASGRAYICELIRLRDGKSELNYAIYHDRYQRTPDGWKFHRARLRDQVPRHHSAGGLGVQRNRQRLLTCRPGTSRRRKEDGDHGFAT
jgi:hypothetical protein